MTRKNPSSHLPVVRASPSSIRQAALRLHRGDDAGQGWMELALPGRRHG